MAINPIDPRAELRAMRVGLARTIAHLDKIIAEIDRFSDKHAQRNCEICGEVFIGRTRKTKYCSKTCANKASFNLRYVEKENRT